MPTEYHQLFAINQQLFKRILLYHPPKTDKLMMNLNIMFSLFDLFYWPWMLNACNFMVYDKILLCQSVTMEELNTFSVTSTDLISKNDKASPNSFLEFSL